MTAARRGSRGVRSGASRAPGGRRGAADATCEPEPGPVPEAVFDRITGPLGPYLRRVARIAALPGGRADEGL